MQVLIAGLVLFLGMHMVTTARGTRAALVARFGEGAYKGLYSLVSAIGLVMIVWGFGRYRSAATFPCGIRRRDCCQLPSS